MGSTISKTCNTFADRHPFVVFDGDEELARFSNVFTAASFVIDGKRSKSCECHDELSGIAWNYEALASMWALKMGCEEVVADCGDIRGIPAVTNCPRDLIGHVFMPSFNMMAVVPVRCVRGKHQKAVNQ